MKYEEKKQRETLRNDEKRYMLCSEHRDVLKLIYFVGDRLMSAPVLIDFLCTSDSEMNFSKAQKLISKLVKNEVLQQEYISLSYNPARTRILYLSKYATAHLKGAPNTIGADVLSRKNLSPAKIEKRVLRAKMIYERYEMFLREHQINDLFKLWLGNASSYAYKNNQYRAYFLRVYRVFKTIPSHFLNRDVMTEYFLYLDELDTLKKESLKIGQASKNNKAGVLDVTIRNGVKFERKQEWNEDATLQKVLANMDIAGITWDGGQLTIDVDYVLSEDKADYKKIIKNLSLLYKLFSLFVEASILNINIQLVFVNELQMAKFEAFANKKNNRNESKLDMDLSKNGVMITDALNISVRDIKE